MIQVTRPKSSYPLIDCSTRLCNKRYVHCPYLHQACRQSSFDLIKVRLQITVEYSFLTLEELMALPLLD